MTKVLQDHSIFPLLISSPVQSQTISTFGHALRRGQRGEKGERLRAIDRPFPKLAGKTKILWTKLRSGKLEKRAIGKQSHNEL